MDHNQDLPRAKLGGVGSARQVLNHGGISYAAGTILLCEGSRDKGIKGMAGALRGSQSAGILVSSETEGTSISPRTLLAEAKGEP